jgi:ubiquinone/menaquinone biosynthesis C-methylase UbiE
MLYDLFDFRRDQYDRFYNEIDYLKTMNESLSKKAKILEYITGKSILDVGPGGGALMDLIIEKRPNANVLGVDIAANVIEELNRKKDLENKKWNVIKGDALELSKCIEKNKIDTIIYSSIIHELFSYIPFNGKKFNYDTIKTSLKSAFDILPPKGRIIIRDGIMTEDKVLKRIIRFKNKEDIDILNRYCNDFEGRKITYDKISDDEVMMFVNDAMEFLYTYTWGENSYTLEVKEQFGYFTPNEYITFINNLFGNDAIIIEKLHFLQDGYEEHLLEKIDFYDEYHEAIKLPDSTCIIVIEKVR